MPKVWLWFSRPQKPNWFQRIIQWRQRGPWSHVRMAFDAGARGWEVLESREGGVRQWFTTELPADVAEVVPVEATAAQIATIRGWWAAHIGAGYDAVGLIEIFLGRPTSDDQAFTCSEPCAASLHAALIFAFADPRGVDPMQLWLMARARQEALDSCRPLTD
jgi:hypothetical protein